MALAYLAQVPPEQFEEFIRKCDELGLLQYDLDGAFYTNKRCSAAVEEWQKRSDNARSSVNKRYGRTTVVEQTYTNATIDIDKDKEDVIKKKSAVSAPPTLSEVLVKSREIGLPESEGKAFFDYWQDRDWKRGKKPMASWTASLRTWKKNCEKFSPEGELQIQIDLAAKCKPTYEQVIAKCTAWLVPANYGNTYFGMREKNLWLNGNQKAVLNWEDDLYFWLKPQGLVI